MGNQLSSSTMYQGESSAGLAAIFTSLSRNDFTRSGSSGANVLNSPPFLYLTLNLMALDHHRLHVAAFDGRG